MKFYILLFLCICYCIKLYTQDIWTAFSIEQCSLDKNIYPWGEELSLSIKGSANSQLQDESIVVWIAFNEQIFKTYHISLQKSSYNNIPFYLLEESINTPYQLIISGNYSVIAKLELDESDPSQKEKIQNLSQGKPIRSYTYKFPIGKEEDSKAQIKESKIVYLKIMRELNNILDDIFIQQKFAAQPKRPNNPYYKTPKQFEMQAWRNWFQEVNKKIETQKSLLRRHKEHSLLLLYPLTHQYLYVYSSLVEDMAGDYANAVYHFKREPDSKFSPPYTMDELYSELNKIYNMHQEMQKELKVNLKKVLGYFPPPPILRP